MFYTINIKTDWFTIEEFNKGNGFYKVIGPVRSDIHYFNNGYWVTLEAMNIIPKEFLEFWDQEEPGKTEEPGKLTVTEDFFLKTIAISKANTQNIKITDIIK